MYFQGKQSRGWWKSVKFFVVISLGKGICYCKHCEKLSGKLFVEFIENNFLEIFKNSWNPTGNVFVRDGDPNQNSKAAKTALDKIGAVKFSISPRRPRHGGKVASFLLLYHLVQGFAIVSSTKNLAVKYLLNL